jgi:hypothetical protein
VIQEEMNSMYLATLRGSDKTKLIIGGLNTYKGYWSSLQANQRLVNAKMAEAGFHALEFMLAPVVYDPACGVDKMYFLNTDYLLVRKSPGRWFTDEAPQVVQGADYTLFPNWTMGNMTCNNRSLQGVIFT